MTVSRTQKFFKTGWDAEGDLKNYTPGSAIFAKRFITHKTYNYKLPRRGMGFNLTLRSVRIVFRQMHHSTWLITLNLVVESRVFNADNLITVTDYEVDVCDKIIATISPYNPKASAKIKINTIPTKSFGC